MWLIEIGLAIAAFRNGWRWRILWPIGAVLGWAFLMGMAVGATGGSAKLALPMFFLGDVALIAALGVMARRPPSTASTSSERSTSLDGLQPLSLAHDGSGSVPAPSRADGMR
jgi:uncharacterized membrane protein YfcA